MHIEPLKKQTFRTIQWCIVILSMLIYANTLNFEHALDDDIVIFNNIFTVKGLKGIPDLINKDSFHGFFKKKKNLVSGGRYRPLSIISFAIENEFFGKKKKDGTYLYNAQVGHFFNLIFYGLCCLLLIKTLKLFFHEDSIKNHCIILASSLFFAMHPLHSEVVANIKGRDEIFTLGFALSALYLMFKYNGALRFALISATLLFLSLLSKENGITFLAIIPLSFIVFKQWSIRKSLIKCWPLLVFAFFYLWLRYLVIGLSQPSGYCEILNNPFCGINDSDKYATILYTWLKYWGLLLFPIDLTHDYYPNQIPILNWTAPIVLISLAINLLAIFGGIYGLIKRHFYGYALAFYWISFSIVSNLLFNVGTFMNERFLFISSIGFCLLLAQTLWYLIEKGINSEKKVNLFILVSILISGLYGFKSHQRSYAWKDNLTLFKTDVKTSSNSIKCNTSYGGKLTEYAETIKNKSKKTKLIREAIGHLNKSIELYPKRTHITSWNLLGKAYAHLKDWKSSRRAFITCLKINPNYPEAKENLRFIAQETEREKDFSTALKLNLDLAKTMPNKDDYWNKAGQIYGQEFNKIDSALFYLQKSYNFNPKNASTIENIGVANSIIGNYPKALSFFLKALALKPKDSRLHLNLHLTYKNLGQKKKAKEHFMQFNALNKGSL